MSDRPENEEEDLEMPKLKVVSKPKNLKKRKRDIEPSEVEDPSKKFQSEEIDGEVGYELAIATELAARA